MDKGSIAQRLRQLNDKEAHISRQLTVLASYLHFTVLSPGTALLHTTTYVSNRRVDTARRIHADLAGPGTPEVSPSLCGTPWMILAVLSGLQSPIPSLTIWGCFGCRPMGPMLRCQTRPCPSGSACTTQVCCWTGPSPQCSKSAYCSLKVSSTRYAAAHPYAPVVAKVRLLRLMQGNLPQTARKQGHGQPAAFGLCWQRSCSSLTPPRTHPA